jgi:cytochrome c peroxidase
MRSQFVSAMMMVGALAFGPGCEVEGDLDDPELEELEGVSAGAKLFNSGTFNGNGTTCKTCHTGSENGGTGTLSPAQVQALFASKPNDVLFQHDRADVMGGTTFNRVRTHATILIDRALPANISIAGSSARSVILPRGIPTTMNTPAMDPVLMYDGRDPNLQVQARGAVLGHAQGTAPTTTQLNDIAEFQQTLFNRQNLKDFVEHGVALSMPEGTTESEIRGRRFFIDDGLSDMDSVGETAQNICGWCHSGDSLNATSQFFGDFIFPLPEGSRFNTALVSELNPLRNKVFAFDVVNPNGTVTRVNSPDPGVMLTNGVAAAANLFKTPTLWGVEDTAPYFHDNSSKTLDQLADHYDTALAILCSITPCAQSVGSIDFSEQDKDDIVAYLLLL